MSETPYDSGYQILPRDPFFEANRAIVEYENTQIIGVTFFAEVNLTEVESVRQTAGARKPSYTAFVAKATAMSLKDFPYANRRVCRSWWPLVFGARLQQFTQCDITVACERSVPGLEAVAFVDVLREVDRLSLLEINDWLHQLAVADETNNQQWREFSWIIQKLPHRLCRLLLRLPCFFPGLWRKYRGGSVLISSPSKYGVDSVSFTWPWPLGISFGLVKRRPIVRGDLVVPCPTFTLTLTFDRRVMAGAQAARFFKRIVDLLEHAETEMAPHLFSSNAASPGTQLVGGLQENGQAADQVGTVCEREHRI